jgi:hypothetical protein
MPQQLLVVLNVCLLILLYLFFARVLRSVWIEMREPVTVPVARVGTKKKQPQKRRPAPAIPSRLITVAPPEHAGGEFPLSGEMTIGRAPGCTVVLDDPYVSSLHTRVHRTEKSWIVDDLGSKNGTVLNGKVLKGPRPLGIGDRLAIGSHEWDVA